MAWKINDEPAAVFGALGELVRQAIPMLALLGIWALSKEQLVGIMLFVSAAITFLTVVFTRRATTTNETANKQIQKALDTDPNINATVKDVIAQVAKET